ncbi:MAG: hypothetical protein LBN19_04655 [Endomicrobium sp.]|jgi:hypothetical protein|nr:hypothetical protein [Endomicrobium sp.]
MACLNNIVINGNVAQTKFRFEESFEDKRAGFLNRYKSPSGKTQYKRCVNSTLRYAGGKSLAVGINSIVVAGRYKENSIAVFRRWFCGNCVRKRTCESFKKV